MEPTVEAKLTQDLTTHADDDLHPRGQAARLTVMTGFFFRRWRWTGALIACGIFVLGLVISEALVREEQARLALVARQRALIIGGDLRADLATGLNANLHLATALAAYITATAGDPPAAEIEAMLAGLYRQTTALRNIGIAPGNRISRVFPRAGNEAALGLYYPDRPEQWPAVERAIREKAPTLDGPLNLVQGGRGLIYRVPVFLPDGRYWGLISAVIDADRYLAGITGRLDPAVAARVALRRSDEQGAPGQVFWGTAATFTGHPVLFDLSPPGMRWQLAVQPPALDRSPRSSARGGGYLLTTVLALLTFSLIRAWQQQRLVNERLVTIAGLLPGMIYQYRRRPDGSSGMPYASDRIRDILRVTPEEVREDAEALQTLLHPDDRARTQATIAESLAGERPWQQRYRVRFPGGEVRWLQDHAIGKAEPDGGHLWHGYLRDITDEVAAEAARESQLRLAASVFANAQEGILITDPHGVIVDVNPGFSRITGYERGEVIGQTPRVLKSGHQDPAFYAGVWRTIHATGNWRGEMWNRNKAGGIYVELLSITAVKDDRGELSHYIGIFSDITPLKQRELELERIAHYDPLTGLANRRRLGERLHQAIGDAKHTGTRLAVAVLDLDDFKPINDQLGHQAGDRVLVEVARRLLACVRAQDTVARLGGDEFVLLLPGLEPAEECDLILRRVLAQITAPVVLDNATVSVSASIGVTLFPPDDHAADQLLRHADHAMYLAKQAGRNRYQLFDGATAGPPR